jgi:transposase
MEYYVGLDVSLKQTSICVVDQARLVVREGVVDSDPEAISVYVRSKAPDAVRIASRPDRRPPGYGLSLSGFAFR